MRLVALAILAILVAGSTDGRLRRELGARWWWTVVRHLRNGGEGQKCNMKRLSTEGKAEIIEW
jgi:hypothetical protein